MIQSWPRVFQGPFQPMPLVPATSAELNPTVTPQRASARAQICLLVGRREQRSLSTSCYTALPFKRCDHSPGDTRSMQPQRGGTIRASQPVSWPHSETCRKILTHHLPSRLHLFNLTSDFDIDLWHPDPGSGYFQIDSNLLSIDLA